MVDQRQQMREDNDKAYRELVTDNNAKFGDGLQPGKVFTVGVADGMAYYRIFKVGKRTCRYEWIDNEHLNPDGYQCQILGHTGSMNTQRLEVLMRRVDTFTNMLSKAK